MDSEYKLPEGWKFEKLGNILDYEQPNNYIINTPILKKETEIPVLTPGKSFIKGYTKEKENIFDKFPVIIFDDFTTESKYVNFKFKVKSSAMKLLTPKNKNISLKFIFYQMQQVKINFNTHKRYYLSTYQNLDFLIPPFEEQQQIVEEIEKQFTKLDDSIKSLQEVKKGLETYRQSVLKNAFDGSLYLENNLIDTMEIDSFNNSKTGQDKPGKLPIINYKDLPSIPSNWKWYEAYRICNSIRDGTHDTPKYFETGIPLITSKNLNKMGLDFKNIKYISNEDHLEIEKRSKVDNNDILFGMIGTIGNPVIVEKTQEFSIKNVGLFKININYLIPKYLYYWLSSSYLMNLLRKKKMIRGTTQGFIPLGNLRMLPVPYCSLEEQQQIVEEIESKFSVIEKVEQTVNTSLKKAEQLRKSILKSAFEGTLVKEYRTNKVNDRKLIKQPVEVLNR